MKLIWAELKDSIPPLNLWNFPSWEVQLTDGKTMKTIELTKEELEAFKVMFDNEQLGDYLSYSESGTLCEDEYSSLFRKLGIELERPKPRFERKDEEESNLHIRQLGE